MEITEDDDFIPSTPENTFKIEKQKKNVSRKSSKDSRKRLRTERPEGSSDCGESIVGCFDFNKPFVYYAVADISSDIKNGSVHLVGIHEIGEDNRHYLFDNFKTRNVKIELSFTLIKPIPYNNEAISIYGDLLWNGNQKSVIVKFYRKELGTAISKYKDNLILISKFIPNSYL